MEHVPPSSADIPRKLRDGLDRIAAVLRTNQWSAAGASGLNPAQVQALLFIAGRGVAGVRVKEIAAHLGVSQPTASDSVSAIERKGLVTKAADLTDTRAVAIQLSPEGRVVVEALNLAASDVEAAICRLTDDEKTNLLLLQIKIIRELQLASAVPPQRLCVSCRYFEPNIHPDAPQPHHCAFVNAAIGDRDLRLDCAEHETAEPVRQAEAWRVFTNGGSVPLRDTINP